MVKGLTYVDGTCIEMLRGNRKPRRNNTSGITGVVWRTRSHRWIASICFKGHRHHLGSFVLFEDAVMARRQAEKELIEPLLAQYE